jgi:arginine repressor
MPKPNQGKDGKRVNKSDAIREMIAQHPQAQSKEIVSLLGERGIKVQPSLVYYIKSKQNQQRRRQKRQRVAATSQQTGTGNPVELVLKVKGLARDAGGIKNLKLLVDALAD